MIKFIQNLFKKQIKVLHIFDFHAQTVEFRKSITSPSKCVSRENLPKVRGLSFDEVVFHSKSHITEYELSVIIPMLIDSKGVIKIV